MARAYGQLPCAILGVEPGSVLGLIVDAAAHELGSRRLVECKGFPNIDLGAL